ncbi:MAG: serine hydrolase domain-containing protein [Cyclobacteriaceae bacterium]
MKSKLHLLLLFLFVSPLLLAQAPSQPLAPGNPASVGISPDRLARLDQLIQLYVDKNWVPGGVFLVARQGKIVYHKSFGHRSTNNKKPYENDNIFRIASMTKAVTTVSIMQLYEQGKLGLDDPVSRFIPAYKEMQVLDTFNEVDSSYTTVPAENPITIRQLLTHTSGITYGPFNPGNIGAVYHKHGMSAVGLSHDEWTTEQFITNLANVPLAFQPGEKYLYGLNMDVLGHIVEVASGMSLSTYFQKNIFDPLGMEDTFFYVPKRKQSRLVPVYTYDQEGALIMAENNGSGLGLEYPTSPDRPHYAGGGGLSSTAEDYAKFIQALVNDGAYNGHRLLGRKTIEVMSSDQLIRLNEEGKGFSKAPGVTYGLGFALLTDQGNGHNSKSPGTYEWGGYFNTKFFIDPEEDLIFVGMTQMVPFYHQEFWERVYAVTYAAIDD